MRKYTLAALKRIYVHMMATKALQSPPHKQVVILAYHAVVSTPLAVGDWCFLAAHDFREHLDTLKKHFHVVSLPTAVELLRNNAVEQPTAVITFDDGYQNNYDVAFPILCEYQLPATIFLATGLINSQKIGWWCRLNQALASARRQYLDWGGERLDLSTTLAKEQASSILQGLVKEHHPSKVEECVDEISRQLDCPPVPEDIPSAYRMLNTASIRAMVDSGLIDFGAHTHSHAILSLLTEKEQISEIGQSLTEVEELTRKPCRLFAYPNGRMKDYDYNCIDFLRSRGVTAAASMVAGPNDCTSEMLELHRYGVGSGTDLTHSRALTHYAGL